MAIKITGTEVINDDKRFINNESLPSTRPSLLLDFANSKSLDPRITFARSSTASYYDGKTYTKAEENLFTYSQEVTTNWTNLSSNFTVTTGITAPDGTSTAIQLDNSSGSVAYYYQGLGYNLSSGTQYTLSFYVKSNTGSSETINLMIPSTAFSTTETATTSWTRVSWSPTLSSSNSFAGLFVASGVDISVWGFQLEQRASVTDYTPTTTQPITNYIPTLQTASSGSARFDHDPVTGESKGLLIEEARTNLIDYSEDFTGYNLGNTLLSSDTVIAPDGTLTAAKLYEDTISSQYRIRKDVSVTAGTATYSIYVKKAQKQYFSIYPQNAGTAYAIFDLDSTSIIDTGGTDYLDSAIEDVGNGWYRCAISLDVTTGTLETYLYLSSDTVAAPTYTGDGYSGIYIWGAQLEAGSFATSYIPTSGSQVTRSADSADMTGTNFSSWFRQDEGTVYVDFSAVDDGNSARVLNFDSGNDNDTRAVFLSGTSSKIYNRANATTDINAAVVASLEAKVAFGYANNDSAGSGNGSTIVSDNECYISPKINALRIGRRRSNTNRMNGTIKKIAYYPLRLTNAELQALTED